MFCSLVNIMICGSPTCLRKKKHWLQVKKEKRYLLGPMTKSNEGKIEEVNNK
jgi:hypothetical protein